jgi:hypothetical protein
VLTPLSKPASRANYSNNSLYDKIEAILLCHMDCHNPKLFVFSGLTPPL